MLVQNMEAAVHGLSLPHVATPPFFLWFIWQGGSGAVLPLAFLLARAKSAQLRSVGRLGIVPALFNVNEPILFGAPVVLSPIGALLSTGGDWRALVLALGNMIVCLLLYWPFVRRYDQALLERESEA